MVTVSDGSGVVYRGSLYSDADIPVGNCTVRIQGGKAFMLSADCPDQLCVRSGAVSSVHPVICLPNRITVTVSGEEDEETDVIPSSDESYLTMFVPMELLLPQMLNHSQLFLAYMSSEGESKEEQFKVTMLALEEFHRQYNDWRKLQ